MKTVYERMADSKLLGTNQLTAGVAPNRTHIAQFVYANGLVVNYDGNKWIVVRPEAAQQAN